MHRGVREFVDWMEGHRNQAGVVLNPPVQVHEIQAIEHYVGSPLPADLRLVLGRFNGAVTPAGTLLSATPGPGTTMEAALREVAAQQTSSFLDPDLLLPFHRTEQGTVLAFDRSAAPLADTWPIVDYDPETGEVRLVHRTFDGWCRLCVSEWMAELDVAFDLEKYLRQGKRHVSIEPDVSIAHVTLGHGRKRAGQPDDALMSYLRGARCIPAIPWADWEALKLAALLGDVDAVLETGARLAQRTLPHAWQLRGTTPSRVLYVLARVLQTVAEGSRRTALERYAEHLGSQSTSEEEASVSKAILSATLSGDASIPAPWPPLKTAVPGAEDLDAWWAQMNEATREGHLRDEDLVLDPTYMPLRSRFELVDLLRIRREF